MLSPLSACGQGSKLRAVLAATALVFTAHAGTFIVNTTGDTHAVSPGTSANDSGGHISLRSATEAADAQGGPATINVPAGAYNLSLGELDVSPNGAQTVVISGAGAGGTMVSQTDPTNRVFNIDFNSTGGTTTTLSGLTIQGGHDGADELGGAGILAGSVTATPEDVLTLNNCVVQNNHCTMATTEQPGGGIQMAGGNLKINACTFNNNSSGQSLGGAVFMLAQSVVSALSATNAVFANNIVTNNSGAGPDGGGAIMIETVSGSVHSLIGCTFTNNRALGNSGDTYGGAIQINGGVLNISSSTFVSNSVTGQGGLGGAIYADSGTVNMSFCRLVGNAASVGGGALYNHGSNLATTTAANNWWGCDGGPGAAGCDVATGDGSTLNFSPWLVIANTASPGAINSGQATTLTASVLTNSAGQTLTAAQISVLVGLPLTWAAGTGGLLGSVQMTIQSNGQATALYTNNNNCTTGLPTVTLDDGTATAVVEVQCPDLTLSKTDSVSGATTLGNNWKWTVHVANAGPAPASFPAGSTIALDNLPNVNITYGSPVVANVTGVSGTPTAGVDGSDNLTVTAAGTVTLNAGGSFDVQVTTTPTVTGSFVNPRSGGLCMVDPGNIISESNEGNNAATDTVVVTCPTITGSVSGSVDICPGGSAVVTVTISGGTAPYSVTLDNGGGTHAGNGPLEFTVNPAATTSYQISSGTDAAGCPLISDGSSATVTVGTLSSPVIALSPPSVFPNSAGNQASVPGVYSSYGWTIANGTIIGPTNQAVVKYVAGVTNNVTLSVAVASGSGCDAGSSAVVPVITGFWVHTNVVFTDALPTTTMVMAFDGTNYWSCSGGGTTGLRLAQYGLNGGLIATYSPGLDFRSLMVRADGTLLAHDIISSSIYQQTSPGVFANSGVTLTGGALDGQSSVVLSGAGTEYDAMSGGVVSRWSTNGTYLGAVNLIGFGALPNENTYPQNRGLGTMGNLWLTYDNADDLSIWDTNGNRVTQITLPGAGTSFDSGFSLSYCNGKVFIVDVAGGAWRGFDLYSAASVAVLSAEPTVAWNSDVASKISGVGSIPKVDVIPVTDGTPALAQLRNYQSVLVYSDGSFADQNAMGNVLADYLDQGGGVVMQTFAFVTNGASYGIAGRVSANGDMPFTATTYLTAASPTLVKDVPGHPLLDGVNTFNGGTSGYQNSPMYTNAGAFQVAHWSSGAALVGGRNDGAGRCVGLNFFPPSSDARVDLWTSSTDGAKLMANGLLWSGKIPPTILSAPADQALPPGDTANFSVIAAGTGPLGYQWRLNGTNLPSATSSTLSVPVQAGNFGAYSVVVSNLYGFTTSLNALLNPQLRFLTPVVSSGGAFSLFLADSDGSTVAANRAARVNLYSAANLETPFSLWSLLTNAFLPSGGQLQAAGFNATNGPARFFRATEAP